MVFSSVVFLFYFLPAVLLLYQLAGNNRRRNFFANRKPCVLYLVKGLVCLYYALFHTAQLNSAGLQVDRVVLAMAITTNLGLLAVFKYANFIVDNLSPLFEKIGADPFVLNPVHLPIGISFFTFQAMSYVIDVYRGKTGAQHDSVGIGLYISLFPQLISGPIIRYHDVVRQIGERNRSYRNFAYGIQRFVFGLAKKVLIAKTA